MKLIKLFLLVISLNIFGQEIPRIKLKDSTYLTLKQLDVKTEIVGNVATTTYKMKFYNDTDRVLEGELAFPLGQGQSVTNFSMDVNGNMRDAVVVEKELGRVAYETTIRQTIDPGLLEITKGNNYKARVYPIPANGYKLLSITFEQEMNASNSKHVYEIPFNFSDRLDFSLDILVYNISQEPKIKNDNNYKLKFKEAEGILKASVEKKNAIVNTSVLLEFSIGNLENVTTYNNYFNVYKLLAPKSRVKEKPDNISIYWDTSYSMKFRNLELELELLDVYFDYLNNVNVNFITFGNKSSNPKEFTVKNGKWKELKNEIESIIYDGGTSYFDIKDETTNEVLFFTDGMFNLGELSNEFKGRLYTINSLKSANHEFLEQVSNNFNGKYINLNFTDFNNALTALKTEAFKFLGITKNSSVSEIYPLPKTTVANDFSVSGKFTQDTEIQLNFGYNNQVTESFTVKLVKSSFNSLVKRIWARKKLQALNINKEENKEQIIELAKKHHLISNYTSLIILDRLEDYVRYKIEPPAELKADYKQRIANREQEEKNRLREISEQKKQLFADYKELLRWYNTNYPIAIKKPQKVENTPINNQTSVNNTSVEQSSSTVANTLTQSQLDSNKRIVSGIISGSDGLPLPGTSIIIKGTTRGTTTDFDGNYSINAEAGDVLKVQYLGFGSKEIVVGSSNEINTIIKLDDSTLDEVVVVAYAATTQKMSLSSSVQVVESESVTEGIQTLQGQVAGIQVLNNSGQLGSSPVLTIRGSNALNNNNTPLYVIDGKVVSDNEFKTIATDSISSMTVLKDESATSLFGNRATNGVIVITTKEGLRNNAEEIQELNKKINDDINFKPWSTDSDYIKQLQTQNSIDDAYKKYLDLRVKYRNTPSFFIEVADYFDSKKEKELAIKVLSNLAEIDLDNHEVMRALAYKLEYFKQYHLALYVYNEVLKLRPEEPQSTRDLALAYENIGAYQKAFDLLFAIIDGQLVEKDLAKRFYGIEHIAFIEACHLIQKHKEEIKLNESQQKLIIPVKVDLRIVADWNHNDTDLDLWVDNPKDQAISYKNKTTDYGDRLSEDMTQGYGPEEFMIKKGIKGDYEIELDYFADEVQKISGPTTLKITIYKNYGSENETKEVRVYKLDKEKDLLEVGTITF